MSIYIIAEIGINHNGDIDIAKKLIDIASDCKVDAVKFQKRTVEIVYSQEILDQHRDSPWGNTQRDQKLGLEFNLEQYQEIDNYCKYKKIDWFASAWDHESQNFLSNFDLKFNKIASAMITNEKHLAQVASEGKHTFISTGMSNFQDIEKAVNIFKKYKTSYELMHCVSTYPMSPGLANLQTINSLREKFKCHVGYSGHETGVAISVAASAFGISSLERHITLDRSMYGSDQSASLEPRGLRELVGSVRIVEKAIGENKIGHFFDEEKEVAKKLRAHFETS